MKVKTFFKIKFNIPDLNKYLPNSEACTDIYEAELVHEKHDVIIKVFHPSKQYLGKKVSYWAASNEWDLVKHFEVTEIIQPTHLKEITFSDYVVIGMQTGDLMEYNETYFSITLSGVRKVYESAEGPTEFFLTKEGFRLVELNYTHPVRLPWTKEPYSWQPQNKVKEFIKFDQIGFRPEHNFYNTTNYSSSTVSIEKEPLFAIDHNNLPEVEIKKHVSLLLALYSFYSQTEINYASSNIQTENKYFFEIKDSETSHDGHGIFRWEFFQNPLNLIESVDAVHLMANREFVESIISKFNYALKTEGESRFMMLYNILEQIRNQYILDRKIEVDKAGTNPNPKKVVQEYEFTVSNTQRDKLIKESLEKVADIVKAEQKQLFLDEISQKIGGIRLLSMANQFSSLFDFLKIDPVKSQLDFAKIRVLRNSIFHGSPADDLAYLEEINKPQRFPKFVGDVMLKYFGIEDVNTISKKWK